MSVSFMDKLASPAYSMINAMQPTMVTMRFIRLAVTVVAVFRERARVGAHSDLSALPIFKQGTKPLVDGSRASTTPDDFISDAKAYLKSPRRARWAIDELVRTGEVDPSAGMETKELGQGSTT